MLTRLDEGTTPEGYAEQRPVGSDATLRMVLLLCEIEGLLGQVLCGAHFLLLHIEVAKRVKHRKNLRSIADPLAELSRMVIRFSDFGRTQSFRHNQSQSQCRLQRKLLLHVSRLLRQAA